jgi:hypothetical protein
MLFIRHLAYRMKKILQSGYGLLVDCYRLIFTTQMGHEFGGNITKSGMSVAVTCLMSRLSRRFSILST